MKNLSVFIINKHQYLKLHIDHLDPDDDLVWKEFSIDFVDKKKNTCVEIGLNTIADFCDKLTYSNFTKKLINNELPIDKIITEDIGKMYNRHHTREQFDKMSRHFFTSNAPCGRGPMVYSWMYNDEKGRIILQVNSAFKWKSHYRKNCKEFKKFLEEYTAFQVVVPKYRLKQWIQQVKKIEKQLQNSF